MIVAWHGVARPGVARQGEARMPPHLGDGVWGIYVARRGQAWRGAAWRGEERQGKVPPAARRRVAGDLLGWAGHGAAWRGMARRGFLGFWG